MKSEHTRNWLIAVIISLVLFIFLFSGTLVNIYTNYLWFRSIDYTEVFNTRLRALIGITIISIIIAISFLILNWALIPHRLFPEPEHQAQVRGMTVDVPTRPIRRVFTLVSIVLGLFFGLSMGGHWDTFLMARNGMPFGMQDPIFGMDIGYYIFQLPWYETLLNTGKSLIAFTFVGILSRYSLFQQIKERGAVAHLSLMGMLWLVFLSASRLIDRYQLLQSDLGVVFGAGYTDINARMTIYIVQAIIFAIAGLLLVINIFTRKWEYITLAGLAWLVVSLIGSFYPFIIQQFRVEPNESLLERPYIEYNITFTRYAYGLDKIQEKDYPATGELTLTNLEANMDIIENVRLWDYRPLLRTYGQLQEIRLYYDFNDVDIDRYTISGKTQQVMLSARELDVEQLAEQAQTWINRHLIFTHGYGLAVNPVNKITTEGLPKLIVRDIPPVSTVPELTITRPEIYFGESTHSYIIVNTTEDEFDYPQGDSNVYTRYEGTDGILMGNFFRQLLFTLRFNSPQIMLSPAINSNSRILFNRTIEQRVKAIAPMLWYDNDPYPVLVDGRIIWLLDAYTWTDRFPYSEPLGGINYLRNSVKISLDAYTGETIFYIVDPEDPIVATYANIFPTLFRPVEEMPENLKAHWRYPETLFAYQSQQYTTYHMRDPQVFYNREDLWDIPQELVETEQKLMEPYYILTRLPGAQELEFTLIRPYTPKEKQNMIAWLFADSDGAGYGTLSVFKLGKDRLIYGPLQIEARADQNPVISQQLSLWNQRGSRVLRGNLIVVPIAGTFLYIEPLYLEAESGQLPELKRIIVAYGDHVAMAPTLDEALLEVLTASGIEDVPEQTTETGNGPTPQGDLESLSEQAWEHYQAAQICLGESDWECYGREQAALEQILRAMVGE